MKAEVNWQWEVDDPKQLAGRLPYKHVVVNPDETVTAEQVMNFARSNQATLHDDFFGVRYYWVKLPGDYDWRQWRENEIRGWIEKRINNPIPEP